MNPPNKKMHFPCSEIRIFQEISRDQQQQHLPVSCNALNDALSTPIGHHILGICCSDCSTDSDLMLCDSHCLETFNKSDAQHESIRILHSESSQ